MYERLRTLSNYLKLVIQNLKKANLPLELQFVNYR
jgi:uncharacterized protein YajQ (UPF0234 family)